MKLRPNLRHLAYTTAIALACFSGAVSTAGLMRLIPGGEMVVAGMGILFEAGKLTSFALLHRRLPKMMKVSLATLGCLLMAANIAGVSGFLSAAYEHQQISAKATNRKAETSAHAEASLLDRQLIQADQAVADARRSVLRAKDDKGRVRAAQGALKAAQGDKDAILAKLSAANATSAQVEGNAIASTSEFAAVQFIAEATGASEDRVAHMAILTIAGLPDFLAVALILAAGLLATKPTKAKTARPPKATRRRRPTRPTELKVAAHNTIEDGNARAA